MSGSPARRRRRAPGRLALRGPFPAGLAGRDGRAVTRRTVPPDMFPPDVNGERVLAPLWGTSWRVSPEHRRLVTEYDPLRFALVYFPHRLRSEATGWRTSFSSLHVAMAASAMRWADGSSEPQREAWIAPREAAKTEWNFLLRPLWALAHGWVWYMFALADSGGQAEQHLANLRRELDTNELLINDYPHLRPARSIGTRNTVRDLDLRSGAAISARGMDAKTLGAKAGHDRPDLIVLDDIEPKGSRYSSDVRDKRLQTIIESVLPMNDRATVQMSGTVTRYGSIMHDLARHAYGDGTEEWITDERFRAHYFPPIETSPDGTERSCWPVRWPLPELHRRRGQGGRSWTLNFENRPPRPGEVGVGWLPSLFLRERFPVTRRVIVVDTSVKSHRHADQTAIGVFGLRADGRRMSVDYVRGYRVEPDVLRSELHRLCRQGVDEVIVEVNQGGDLWRRILSPLPRTANGREITYTGVHTSTNKEDRIMDSLDLYGRGMITHPATLGELEDQQLRWPDTTHDDLVDVVSIAAERLMTSAARL